MNDISVNIHKGIDSLRRLSIGNIAANCGAISRICGDNSRIHLQNMTPIERAYKFMSVYENINIMLEMEINYDLQRIKKET